MQKVNTQEASATKKPWRSHKTISKDSDKGLAGRKVSQLHSKGRKPLPLGQRVYHPSPNCVD